MSVSGIKHDEGKLRWDLLPFEHIEEVVRVLTHGAKKYSGDNWKHVPDPKNRYFAAAMRHITAWRKGERFDADSNNNLHLAAVIANILFLMHFDKEENA